MKPDINKIPDLVEVDVAIRRLTARVAKLEQTMQMAMRQGGPGWVNQVGDVARKLEAVMDSLHRTVVKYNSIKAGLFK